MPEHSNQLLEFIKHKIEQEGPLSLETYWDICLSHPECGYYIKQDPLGRGGDFITAPEISQMFGEMIGVWCAYAWTRMGQPEKFHLIECGPGRGTLMLDLLRGTRNVAGFGNALQIHLVETSPSLGAKQKETLKEVHPFWHSDISSIPCDAPSLFIGNEFLDALPIRQFIKSGEGWHERLVGMDEKGCLAFRQGPLTDMAREGKEGDIAEISPMREKIMEQIYDHIRICRGAALMIDYGYGQKANGDTFQAVKNHAYCSPLEETGNVDLTSHVDFYTLGTMAKEKGLSFLFSYQGDFLRSMGIELRAVSLMQSANLEQRKYISSGLERLTEADQMGQLFKVLEVINEQAGS